MIAGLGPYPVMKDSGVPWLGEVPEHWATSRLKSMFREVDRRSGSGGEPLLSLRMQHGLVDHHAMGGRPIPPSSLVNYKRTEPGEIVMNRMRAASGLFAATPKVGLVSPDYAVLRPRGLVELQYFVHLFRTPVMMSIFRLESRGLGTGESGFLRLYSDRFGILPAPFPPPAEQTAIVRFLDHADRRIRRYIVAKQRLIKLLEEQRQAIIHRAVTRGLDPNVRLKPSGVEWLGGVPEHWAVARLKDAAVVQTGLTLGKGYQGVATEVRPYLRVANVQVGRVDLRHVKHIEVPASEADGVTLRAGDVLMTEGGDIDKLGRGCVWHGQIPGCLHQNHIFAVRCRQELLVPEFLVGLMASLHGRTYFQLTAKQTTNLASTNSTTLRAFPIMLPPLEEQGSVLQEIARQTAGMDAATARARTEIALLHEYRTRLIADVVTGKLDAREAAARLPDEAEEQEPLDEADALADGEVDEADDLDAAPEEAEA